MPAVARRWARFAGVAQEAGDPLAPGYQRRRGGGPPAGAAKSNAQPPPNAAALPRSDVATPVAAACRLRSLPRPPAGQQRHLLFALEGVGEFASVSLVG